MPTKKKKKSKHRIISSIGFGAFVGKVKSANITPKALKQIHLSSYSFLPSKPACVKVIQHIIILVSGLWGE